MKRSLQISVLIAVLIFLAQAAWGRSVMPPPGESEDKTLSPYFFVKSDDSSLDQLPLKGTSVRVDISGVIADVRVAQVYRNGGKRPLEAIYIFPASTRAAVYGMKMTIGKRTIEAKISKREEARRDYEEALRQGRSASLLEQQRPNVFQMNVGNILPGDEIRVELKYTELLVPTDRIYEFVYPTVVGPRYSNQSASKAPAAERWVENPYLHQGQAPTCTFDISTSITAGMPIRDLACTSHKVKAAYSSPSVARIDLDPTQKDSGNRDYVLRYRLAGDRIRSGLLLYEGDRENFFLLMLQPPKRVAQAQIPGRDYVFIVDVSGSMHGYPLDVSKKLLSDLIGGLRPSDSFNVLLFSGASSVMAGESVPATADNVRRALDLIDRQQGGGGTELLPAFTRALDLKKKEGYSRTIVIATDGYVTVEEEVFDLIRGNLDKTNVFAFGIGTSVNRHLMEGMARAGMGESFIITRPEEAASVAGRFRKMIQFPVLTGIDLKVDSFSAYDIEPLRIPDILAERPVILFGKYRGKPQGAITITGRSGEGPFRERIDIGKSHPSKGNAALRYLWARHRIALLSDYENLHSSDRRIKEVTDLGLGYNLLTRYTSFVAIDSEVRNKNGRLETVKQPLPLPQGVSDYAVGRQGGLAGAGYAMRAKVAHDAYGAAPLAVPPSPVQETAQNFGTEKKKEGIAPKLNLKHVAVSAGLSGPSVSGLVQENLHALESCMSRAITGEVVVKMTIGKDGAVSRLVFSGLSREIAQCWEREIRTWHFPRPGSGREENATLSFKWA